MFCKEGAPRNFAKFTAKHLCLSLFFIKKDSGTDVFQSIFQNFQEHLFLFNTSGGCFCSKLTVFHFPSFTRFHLILAFHCPHTSSAKNLSNVVQIYRICFLSTKYHSNMFENPLIFAKYTSKETVIK